MKKFLLLFVKSITFFTSLIIILFCFKLVFFKMSREYYMKNYNFKRLNNIEVGIFGHSQSQCALDEILLNSLSELNFENFSISGNALYYNVSLIQNMLDINPNMLVVIEIGSNNLDENWSKESLFSESRSITFFDFFYYTLLDEDSKFLVSNPITNYLITGSFNFPMINFLGSITQDSRMDEAYKNFENILQKPKRDFILPLGYYENFEIDRLIRLIKKNRQTNFLIIRVPEHELNKRIYPYHDRYKTLMLKLKNESNVKIKDYIDFDLSEDSYRDFNHLSLKGREIFTKFFFNDNFNIQ